MAATGTNRTEDPMAPHSRELERETRAFHQSLLENDRLHYAAIEVERLGLGGNARGIRGRLPNRLRHRMPRKASDLARPDSRSACVPPGADHQRWPCLRLDDS